MSTVTVKDVGPVERVEIPVPAGGGLVVLRGRNGAGKTKTLEAVESLVSGRGKVEVRDGSLRGVVEGFGATIKVAKSMIRSGELEVTTLEGKLSVADLVDPGIKSPEAADQARIRALVQLSGIEPDLALFYSLIGTQEEFEEVAAGAEVIKGDLVATAAALKRRLELAARTEQGAADTAAAHSRAKRESIAGIDLEAVCDAAKLQEGYKAAIAKRTTIENQMTAATEAVQVATRAKQALHKANADYTGPTVGDALKSHKCSVKQCEVMDDQVLRCEDDLRRARDQKTQADANYQTTLSALELATNHEKNLDAWQQSINASIGQIAPDDSELALSDAEVKAAYQSVEQGALIRKARLDADEAAVLERSADTHAKLAHKLRHAAKGTDDVLSEVVSKSGSALRVEAGRLVLTTKRGDTYFGELSHGERWKLALDLAIEHVGADGLLVIPQTAYESLDPQNRRLIAEHLKGKGVVVLTAEASDDEAIVAEEFSAS